MTHEISWDSHGIYRRFLGTITSADLKQINEEFYADPRALRIHYQIIDAREIEALEIDETGIRDRVAYDLGFSRSTRAQRVALISDNPEVLTAFNAYADLMRSAHSSWTCRTFSTLEDALDWAKS